VDREEQRVFEKTIWIVGQSLPDRGQRGRISAPGQRPRRRQPDTLGFVSQQMDQRSRGKTVPSQRESVRRRNNQLRIVTLQKGTEDFGRGRSRNGIHSPDGILLQGGLPGAVQQ